MQTTLKHSMSCLPDSEILADVDAGAPPGHAAGAPLDSQHVADFVTRLLPEQGVVAFRDDSRRTVRTA
jgi:hypothetical protein